MEIMAPGAVAVMTAATVEDEGGLVMTADDIVGDALTLPSCWLSTASRRMGSLAQCVEVLHETGRANEEGVSVLGCPSAYSQWLSVNATEPRLTFNGLDRLATASIRVSRCARRARCDRDLQERAASSASYSCMSSTRLPSGSSR